MRTNAVRQRDAEREASKEAYAKNPNLCACGCGKPVPWRRWTQGGKFASQVCSRQNAANGNKHVEHKLWYCYMVLCNDGSYYTGITVDLRKRLHQHNHTVLGAKYTRTRRPVTLAYHETFANRTEAARREAAIKKLSHREKAKLWTDDLKLGNVNG